MSVEPTFVMQPADAAAKPNMHYNLTWNSLEEVSYPRLPSGKSLTIFSPNVRNPVEVLPTEYVIITRCTRSLPDDPAPLAHCAHYHYNKRCARGADCGFVHVARLNGMKPHYINISPATVAGYRASEAKRTSEHSHRAGGDSGKLPQPLMVPVPVPPFSPFPPGNEALMSGGMLFQPSMAHSAGGAPAWTPTGGEIPGHQMGSALGAVTQLPIRVGMPGGGLPQAGGFYSQQGIPSQHQPPQQTSTAYVASYQPTSFTPSPMMQWPPSVFEQQQQPQLQNPAPLAWSSQPHQFSQVQQQSLGGTQPPPTAIIQPPPQFHGMGGDSASLWMAAANPNPSSSLPSQQPQPMFVFLPSFPGQNPPSSSAH